MLHNEEEYKKEMKSNLKPVRHFWVLVLLSIESVSAGAIGGELPGGCCSLSERQTPIALIPFPAVTFCPARKVSDESILWNMPDTDSVTSEELDVTSAVHMLCPRLGNTTAESQTPTHQNLSLKAAINKVSVNCEDVIEWFKYGYSAYQTVQGQHSSCSRAFQKIYVDEERVCFTFNMLPMNHVLRDHVIPPAVDESTIPGRPDWSPDSMFSVPPAPGDLGSAVPRHADSNGRWSGLYIGLFNFTEDDDSDCGATTRSKMFFHHPAELPMSQIHESIEIPKHEELFVRVLPSVVALSEQLSYYPPQEKHCYMSAEKKLSLFKMYTQNNCQLECRVNCSLSLCDCVPFYLPRGNSSVKICDTGKKTSCYPFLVTGLLEERFSWADVQWDFGNELGPRYKKILEGYENRHHDGAEMTEEDLKNTFPNECRCDCPPECNSLRYDVKVEQGHPFSDKVPEQFSRVAVSFKESEVTTKMRKEIDEVVNEIREEGVGWLVGQIPQTVAAGGANRNVISSIFVIVICKIVKSLIL